MKPQSLTIATLLAFTLSLACQKPAPPAPPPGAPGHVTAPVVPTPAAPPNDNHCDTSGASCNSVALQGAPVDAMQVDTAPPAPTGGKIPPGLYSLVGTTIYTGVGGAKGPTNHPERMTIQLTETPTGMVVQDAEAQPGCASDKHETNTLTFSGTNVAAVRTCPPCDPKNDPYCQGVHTYSWTGGQLVEFIHQENVTWARTFSLTPAK